MPNAIFKATTRTRIASKPCARSQSASIPRQLAPSSSSVGLHSAMAAATFVRGSYPAAPSHPLIVHAAPVSPHPGFGNAQPGRAVIVPQRGAPQQEVTVTAQRQVLLQPASTGTAPPVFIAGPAAACGTSHMARRSCPPLAPQVPPAVAPSPVAAPLVKTQQVVPSGRAGMTQRQMQDASLPPAGPSTVTSAASPSDGVASARAAQSASSSITQAHFAWVEQRLSSPSEFDQSYTAMINALLSWGWLDGLQADAGGMLRVHVPFCNEFHEAPLLLPFLFGHVLPRCGATGVSLWMSDLRDASYMWKKWQEWGAHVYGEERVKFEFSQADLSTTPIPGGAGLVLGAHPCVTYGDPWPAIFQNCLKSCEGTGRCIFTTFYNVEAQRAVEVCRNLRFDCEVRESPRYSGMPELTQYSYFRYAVLVKAR